MQDCAAESPFDFEQIVQGVGGEEIAVSTLRGFVVLSRDRTKQIHQLCNSDSLKEAAIAVHGFKSSALWIHALPLAQGCASLHEALESGDKEAIANRLETFWKEYQLLFQCIVRFLKTLPRDDAAT